MCLKKKLKNAGRVIFFVNKKTKITIYFAFSSIFKIIILLQINSKIGNFFKNEIWLSQNFSRFSKKVSKISQKLTSFLRPLNIFYHQ